MELCVQRQVKSGCYLRDRAGPSKTVRAAVSWLRPKRFVRVERRRVARITATQCGCASSKGSSPVIRTPFFNSGLLGSVPHCEGGGGNSSGGSGSGSGGGGGGDGGGGEGNGGEGPCPEPHENHSVFALALAGFSLFPLQQQAAHALSGHTGSGPAGLLDHQTGI